MTSETPTTPEGEKPSAKPPETPEERKERYRRARAVLANKRFWLDCFVSLWTVITTGAFLGAIWMREWNNVTQVGQTLCLLVVIRHGLKLSDRVKKLEEPTNLRIGIELVPIGKNPFAPPSKPERPN